LTEAHELLEQLVALPSVAGRPNDEIAQFISGWLRGHGVECAEVRGENGRVNLLASTGSAGDGVLLAAHMDVVEVEGQPWSGDPWHLRRDGNRLVGRGSADMKGFLACAMRAMADATALELREPLRLAVSTDEEIGCVGVRDLLPVIAALPQRPRACLVGEPTAACRRQSTAPARDGRSAPRRSPGLNPRRSAGSAPGGHGAGSRGPWGEDQVFHAPPPIGTQVFLTSPISPPYQQVWTLPLTTFSQWPVR
jgi:acetylornithine deacetylase/succinyl-diaminopimelate desuccinylase-like protein